MVTTSIIHPAFWGPQIPSPFIKKEIPSRVWIWFHPWECVGRLGLGLIRMNRSALSPLPFGSLMLWHFFGEMGAFWSILEKRSFFRFHGWKEALARVIFSGDSFLKRHKVITENLATCVKVSPWKLSVMNKPDLAVNWWGLQTHPLLK